MKKNTKVIIGVVIIIVIGLFFWGSKNQQKTIVFWNDTEIECLSNGHANLAQHIHPTLTVLIDGEVVSVPANIGVTNTCMAEVHTHDASGQIHIETVEAGKTFGVEEFFTVWGEEYNKEGYTRTVTVNGREVDSEEYEMRDLDQIEVQYISSNVAL